MSNLQSNLATTIAPVVPTRAALGRLRPLGLSGVHLDGGFWGARRLTNRDVTIPHGLAQLEAAGNLANFALAAGGTGGYAAEVDDAGHSFPFLDSDVYKWLEAVGWELGSRADPELEASAAAVIDTVAAAQRDDGYLNTFFQVTAPGREFTDLEWGHELYTLGHLIQAAIAWLRAVGDDRLLAIAHRALIRLEHEVGPGKRELVDGHPEIEMALVELYRTTGEARHLELARRFVERRGLGLLGAGRFGPRYWQDHESVRDAREPAGHAVRQLYLDCGVVDVAVETGDEQLLAAAVARWEVMASTRTYLTGGLGSRHRDEAFGDAFELPPDLAYAETCAAIASVMLSWRLLLATGEARFADMIERTTYNAVLASVSCDGRAFFYSNPLQRRSGGVTVQAGPVVSRRAPWFACACCPPNLMRFIATLPDLVATTGGGGLQVHQPAAGSVESSLPGGIVKLTIATGYPWDGTVRVTVVQTPIEPWTLSLRVPAWAGSAILAAPDGGRDAKPGYETIARSWAAGDVITLRLDMPGRITLADPRIDAVRGTAAIERGPIVYALEEADIPEGTALESLELDTSVSPIAAPAGEGLFECVTPLEVAVRARSDPTPQAGWPYSSAEDDGQPAETAATSAVRMLAVPYFAWGNRLVGGMRVWIPVANPARARQETSDAR